MITIGIKGTQELTVTQELTAAALGSGLLEVFATPALVALAEETAWKSVAGELNEGEGTVGTSIALNHLAATPLGMKVRCESELMEVDRRKLVFSFAVFDEKEKVAEGRHERFIVDSAKFLTKTESKRA